MATKVTLRQKPISGDRQSLFLDFYPEIAHPETGEPTRREFLSMYVFDKPRNPLDKQHNKETLQVAEQIRQRRENALNKPEIYEAFEREQLRMKEKGERDFVAYFKAMADQRKGTNYDNWVSACNYLETFTKGSLKFADLNDQFCRDFQHYLLTTKSNRSQKASLSQNSAVAYFGKLKAAMKQAYKDGYLQTDLNAKVEGLKPAESQRNFLTIEELNALAKTDCPNPLLKQAALFSALTGLRFSDIEKLVWGEVAYIEGSGHFVRFTQKKTQGVEMLPISDQAYGLLGERTAATDRVFEGLVYSAYSNRHLAKWVGLAGITKDITFHCFRHTFATLQLSQGTDIYTVSKMLGHRELKTTQVYAKIIDQTKRDAANKIHIEM